MRIAVVSDIHGNLTAFEAVLKNLRESAPDLVLHGGDLAEGGARPVEVIDSIRSLGWQGVVGNTDEVLSPILVTGIWTVKAGRHALLELPTNITKGLSFARSGNRDHRGRFDNCR